MSIQINKTQCDEFKRNPLRNPLTGRTIKNEGPTYKMLQKACKDKLVSPISDTKEIEPNKLIIVAHPDDELLWGGANLLSEPGWMVVVATNKENKVRSKQFYKTMSYAGVWKYDMYNVEDKYTDDQSVSDKLFQDNDEFIQALIYLNKKKWSLILTHNSKGEYGHTHHISVHRLVNKYMKDQPNLHFFSASSKQLPTLILYNKVECMQFYSATENVAKLSYRKKWSDIRQDMRNIIRNEYIYTSKKSIQIPVFIHQIWFGKEMPEYKKYLINNNRKIVGENGGYYKLWTNTELTEKELPLTYDKIQESLEIGNELEQNRWAQVADLARYEIIHRFGGVYLDSNFEISPQFISTIKVLSNKGIEFIGANEDPCEWNCIGGNNKEYLSNGFFASVPLYKPICMLIQPDNLDSIDLYSVYINKTTGPYYFRQFLNPGPKSVLLPTDDIYPFMINDSEYRKKKHNPCLHKTFKPGYIKVNDTTYLEPNCLNKYYPNSIALYHSGLGGSWSW